LWDRKFLPVSSRSVIPRVPKDSPRYRSLHYGAWYVPVDSWKDMVTDARRRQTRSRNGSMPQMTGKEEEKLMSLMEKAQDEIVKLPGSKMFYKFLKNQNLRVPSCLKGIETAEES